MPKKEHLLCAWLLAYCSAGLPPQLIKIILASEDNFYLPQAPAWDQGEGLLSKIVRDVYVIEVENTKNTKTIYPSISHCAKAIGVSRPTLLNRIETGNPLLQKDLIKIRKVRVFN